MHPPQTCALFFRCQTQAHAATPDEADAIEKAWAKFIEIHGARIRHLFARLLHRHYLHFNHQDLEDFIQDFYYRLLTSPRAFSGRSDPQLWRYFESIAENLIIDRFRFLKRGKRREVVFKDRGPMSLSSAELLQDLQSPTANPEQMTLRREQRRLFFKIYVQRFVRGRRSRIKRRALLLALADGWSSREISQALENRLTPGNVDLLVHRFRRCLAEQGLCLPRRRVRPIDRIKNTRRNHASLS